MERLAFTAIVVLVFLVGFGASAFGQEQLLQKEIWSLVADLISQNYTVSLKAIDSLAELGEKVVPNLTFLYNTSDDAMVRSKVIQVFRKIGGPKVIPILLSALQDSESLVRSVAASSLKEIGEVGVENIQESLIVDHHYASKAIVEVLRMLGETDLDILNCLMDELPHRTVAEQKYIARILGEIGSKSQQYLARLLEVVNDESYELRIRLHFLQTLANLDHNSIPMENWVFGLDSASIEHFERLFWIAMDTFREAEKAAIPILQQALIHKNPEIRARAAILLGNMEEEADEAYPQLIVALSDEKWYVQQEAYNALKKLGYQVEQPKITVPMENITEQGNSVNIRDLGDSVELSNGIIKMLISKTNVRVTRLEAYGKELLGTSGRMYFDFNGTGGYWSASGDEYQVIQANAEIAHIMLKRWATTERPFEIEIHFVLKRGESGFYSYAVFRHNLEVAATLEQTRHVLRVDQTILPYMIISDYQQGAIPLSTLFKGSENVADATDRLADGSVYSKYNWAVYEGEHHVHGIAGNNLGIWSISASNEYLNGGPTKQNLTVHHENVLLRMLHSSHFGSGKLVLPANSGWEKIYGPYFTYINSGENLSELWTDAKLKADTEIEKWPYYWVDNPLYPLERGKVNGTLKVTDGSSAAGAWVVLAQPSPNWQFQGTDYIFWSKADENGNFEISNVRPGEYSLYAYGSGIVGEFRYDEVQVTANNITDLGQMDWASASFGKQLWEIGIPNRSAKEFFIPREHYRHWGMWEDYFKYFQDEPAFIIGESDYTKDWLYAQYTSVSGKNLSPREIRFFLPEDQVGEGIFTLLIAGSAGANVNVELNGTSIGQISTSNDASVYRSGIQGIFQEFYMKFDASILRKGENVIRLVVSGSRHGLMYDYLRLEVRTY